MSFFLPAFLSMIAAFGAMAMSPCIDWTETPPDSEQQPALKKIKHIVVLMLENRSFDNMLGKLYPKSDQFDGLSGEEFNIFTNEDGIASVIQVWNEFDGNGAMRDATNLPDPDPGESYDDIAEQLFGRDDRNAAPTMGGFAQNYFRYSMPASPDGIMHYYLPEQVPILSELAKNYAVCDAWFASAPCQTWPNRFFLHTATAGGYENNSPVHFPYEMPTIFTRFNQLSRKNGWKIYFHDFPHSAVLSNLWLHFDHFHEYSQFKEDAANGSLPSYSFIEPRYYSEIDFPSDQHPPHDVRFGEELIADIFNTLQASPAWKNTLLIITYDEHGGCYDHVPPPKAIPPETPKTDQLFSFDRYGVRVPAVIISPYIKAGTVFRAPSGSQPFDHTSVIATIRRCFDLGEPLSDRDRNAPDLSSLLTLSDDQLNLGKPLAVPYVARLSYLLEREKAAGLSEWQKSLHAISAILPNLRGLETEMAREEEVRRTISQLIAGDGRMPPEHLSYDKAYSHLQEKLSAFLQAMENE